MSTKSSIKWSKESVPGYHLYTDVMDTYDEGEPPVYLELVGVSAELYTIDKGGAVVTVTIPAKLARELGLLPSLDAAGETSK